VEILRSEQNCSLMFVCGTCHPELLAQVLRLLEVDPLKPPRILHHSAKRKQGAARTVTPHGKRQVSCPPLTAEVFPLNLIKMVNRARQGSG